MLCLFSYLVRMRMPLRQLALQTGAVFLILSLAWPYYGLNSIAIPWQETAFFIGGAAFILACLTRQPWWWRLIHGFFMPLAWVVSQWSLDPGWFMVAFIVMLLVYRGAVSGQVPLYLSNRATAEALAGLLESKAPFRILDLGAGLGSLLLPLARRFPDCYFTGVENAPLTWLIGWLRTRAWSNIDWRWGDLWRTNLAEFDVVYAFLSPVPMAELWQKAEAEMRPGSLFISNSFAVPEREADQVIEIDSMPPRSLFIYRLPT